ncbi:response regulator [Streptomyces sp. GC420]|nr:response regulator [Streptomyces sp. GC420]
MRVLLVDDEQLVRVALQHVLGSAEGITVVGACDGPGALAEAEAARPDLVLVDVHMPTVDGLTVLRQLRALPRPPVVAMLTAMATGGHLHASLREGAAGFLLKDSPPQLLIESVRVLAAGGVVCTPAVSHSVLSALSARPPASVAAVSSAPTAATSVTGDAAGDGAPGLPGLPDLPGLTPREREVLALVADGLPNSAIAERLGMGLTTVKTHIGALKRKLNAPNRVALAGAVYAARG